MAAKALLISLALCALAAVATAQIQVCDNKMKPGQVPISSNVKLASTTNSGSYSDLKLEWQRPRDRATSNGLDSCITFYDVSIIRSDGKAIQQSKVDVSPAHASASYHAKGLNAGETYKFQISATGPGGQGPKNGPSGAFTTAAKPPVTAVPLRRRV